MKTNFKNMFMKMLVLTVIVVFSFSNIASANTTSTMRLPGQTRYETVKAISQYYNLGKVQNIVLFAGPNFKGSDWTKDLVNSYGLTWYEKPTRQVTKGEFMLAQLRVIQEALERRGLNKLSATKEVLNFKDVNTLTESIQEEVKILKSLGILNGNSDGYMKLTNPISRSEAAKILFVVNDKILKIPEYGYSYNYTDISKDMDKMIKQVGYIGLLKGVPNVFNPKGTLTLEETLQILDKEIVPYSSIQKTDVAKAMNQTFKVALDADLLNVTTSKNSYVKYEEIMKSYGLDKLYNNNSAKTGEYVTKVEALKLAIGVTLNVNDISGFAEEHNEYENAIWVEYAKFAGITNEDININNYNDKANYIDVISYFQNCKTKFLKELPIKDTVTNLNDISKYSSQQQVAIKDMLANGVINPIDSNLNGSSNVTKGKLNELCINFSQKYSLITINGDKINTDLKKMPLNSFLYPYILSGINNSIYNIPLKVKEPRYFLNATQLFEYKKDNYSQVKSYTEEFLNSILNIDYKTITVEGLSEKLKPYLVLDPYDFAVEKYVKNVKDNEIVIEGKSIAQLPVIYFDGYAYRIRMKVTFEIKHSKTKQNLLYLDMVDPQVKTYEKTSYDLLIDCSLSNKIGDNKMYLDQASFYESILIKDGAGITNSNNN